MSQPLVDLQTHGNWVQVFNEARRGVQVTDTDFAPIPAFEIGFLFEAHILAVRTSSTTAKAHWRFAGLLNQRFQIGTGGAASPLPVVTAGSHATRLNRSALIQFERLTSNYELLFEPAYWLRDLQLTIWEYRGNESDTTEAMLRGLIDTAERIEVKLDARSV